MKAIPATFAFLTVLTGGAASAGEKAGDPGTNVEMPFLIAPVATDGKLTGYAYISSKVVTTSRIASLEVREKIPFIQDAFVRDVNSTAIGDGKDSVTVDRAMLVSRLTSDVRRIVGADKIAAVVVIEIQLAPLQPTQTPVQNASATPPG